MSVKERILTIRLLARITEQPDFADTLGIEVICKPPCQACRNVEKLLNRDL